MNIFNIYYCVTIAVYNRNSHLQSVTVLWIRKSAVARLVSVSQGSVRGYSSMLSGAPVTEDLARATWSITNVAFSRAWQINAGSRLESTVPLHLGLPTGLLEHSHGAVAGYPHSKWSKRPRQTLYNFLASKIIHHHFLFILLVTQSEPWFNEWGQEFQEGRIAVGRIEVLTTVKLLLLENFYGFFSKMCYSCPCHRKCYTFKKLPFLFYEVKM